MLLFVVTSVVLQAKDYFTLHAVSPASFKQIDRLKVFLEGRGLDFNYIRRNIDFIDFVNDPKVSDVHIIVTHNQTGGGGTNYVLNFYSSNLGQIGDYSLNCMIMPGDTPDMVREYITQTLKLGLMPYINETNDGSMISIQYTNNGNGKKETPESIDKWKNWVFRADANGGFRLEESISRYNYSYSLRADKVTEKVKMRLSHYESKRYEEINTNGNLLTSENINKNSNIQNVFSLSDSWSVGLFLSYYQSTYLNTEHSFGLKPAIEYNFFPWDEADKRMFTIAYFAGLEAKDYYETTIFGKENENIWAHNLKLDFELVQPWGGVETRLEGSTYLHDFSKNRVTFSSGISFRITRGLSFNLGLRAENVHNQLYLPAKGVSIEDILMGNQKLPSTFELSGDIGIRIQFGSLYNNVVNSRL